MPGYVYKNPTEQFYSTVQLPIAHLPNIAAQKRAAADARRRELFAEADDVEAGLQRLGRKTQTSEDHFGGTATGVKGVIKSGQQRGNNLGSDLNRPTAATTLGSAARPRRSFMAAANLKDGASEMRELARTSVPLREENSGGENGSGGENSPEANNSIAVSGDNSRAVSGAPSKEDPLASTGFASVGPESTQQLGTAVLESAGFGLLRKTPDSEDEEGDDDSQSGPPPELPTKASSGNLSGVLSAAVSRPEGASSGPSPPHRPGGGAGGAAGPGTATMPVRGGRRGSFLPSQMSQGALPSLQRKPSAVGGELSRTLELPQNSQRGMKRGSTLHFPGGDNNSSSSTRRSSVMRGGGGGAQSGMVPGGSPPGILAAPAPQKPRGSIIGVGARRGSFLPVGGKQGINSGGGGNHFSSYNDPRIKSAPMLKALEKANEDEIATTDCGHMINYEFILRNVILEEFPWLLYSVRPSELFFSVYYIDPDLQHAIAGSLKNLAFGEVKLFPPWMPLAVHRYACLEAEKLGYSFVMLQKADLFGPRQVACVENCKDFTFQARKRLMKLTEDCEETSFDMLTPCELKELKELIAYLRRGYAFSTFLMPRGERGDPDFLNDLEDSLNVPPEDMFDFRKFTPREDVVDYLEVKGLISHIGVSTRGDTTEDALPDLVLKLEEGAGSYAGYFNPLELEVSKRCIAEANSFVVWEDMLEEDFKSGLYDRLYTWYDKFAMEQQLKLREEKRKKLAKEAAERKLREAEEKAERLREERESRQESARTGSLRRPSATMTPAFTAAQAAAEGAKRKKLAKKKKKKKESEEIVVLPSITNLAWRSFRAFLEMVQIEEFWIEHTCFMPPGSDPPAGALAGEEATAGVNKKDARKSTKKSVRLSLAPAQAMLADSEKQALSVAPGASDSGGSGSGSGSAGGGGGSSSSNAGPNSSSSMNRTAGFGFVMQNFFRSLQSHYQKLVNPIAYEASIPRITYLSHDHRERDIAIMAQRFGEGATDVNMRNMSFCVDGAVGGENINMLPNSNNSPNSNSGGSAFGGGPSNNASSAGNTSASGGGDAQRRQTEAFGRARAQRLSLASPGGGAEQREFAVRKHTVVGPGAAGGLSSSPRGQNSTKASASGGGGNNFASPEASSAFSLKALLLSPGVAPLALPGVGGAGRRNSVDPAHFAVAVAHGGTTVRNVALLGLLGQKKKKKKSSTGSEDSEESDSSDSEESSGSKNSEDSDDSQSKFAGARIGPEPTLLQRGPGCGAAARGLPTGASAADLAAVARARGSITAFGAVFAAPAGAGGGSRRPSGAGGQQGSRRPSVDNGFGVGQRRPSGSGGVVAVSGGGAVVAARRPSGGGGGVAASGRRPSGPLNTSAVPGIQRRPSGFGSGNSIQQQRRPSGNSMSAMDGGGNEAAFDGRRSRDHDQPRAQAQHAGFSRRRRRAAALGWRHCAWGKFFWR